MGEASSSVIELLVGIGCIVAAVPLLRHRRWWLGGALAVAGVVAVVHALVELATR